MSSCRAYGAGMLDKKPRLTRASGRVVCLNVSNMFASVLLRSPDVQVEVLDNGGNHELHMLNKPKLRVTHRDNVYWVRVNSRTNKDGTRIFVYVEDLEDPANPGFPGQIFFKYATSAIQLGKIRKTALILLKKMNNRVVFDIMNA